MSPVSLLALANVPGWQDLKETDVAEVEIEGGLTNLLSRVFITNEQEKEREHQEVLVRRFGEGTEKFIDRKIELAVTLAFGKAGVGPKVIKCFNGGRIEQFLRAHHLKAHELRLPAVYQEIATKIARCHSMKVSEIPRESSLMANIRKSLAFALEVRSELAKKTSVVDWTWLETEVGELEHILEAVGSPIVFCHCDLQEGNILRLVEPSAASNGNLVLIDFEYGGYNPRGFEFANHFCEWVIDNDTPVYPHFAVDRSAFPSEQTQRDFFQTYLLAQGTPVTEEAIAQLNRESSAYVLASHMLWLLWGLVQAQEATVRWGYVEYAEARLELYKEHKARLGF